MAVAKSVPTPTPPPVVTPDRLEVWVPGRLVNPLNAREHHHAKARRVRRERDAMSMAVWEALRGIGVAKWKWQVRNPAMPKIIMFTLHVPRAFDDDAWPAICKAFRDGLQDAGVTQGDAPADGHTWRYSQVVTRAWAGVRVVVEKA